MSSSTAQLRGRCALVACFVSLLVPYTRAQEASKKAGSGVASPAAPQTIESIIEAKVPALFAKKERHRSLVVGVIDGEARFVRGYGKISRKDPRAPDGDTVYEIGSISKVFTGLLMALDVGAERYKETTPVRDLLSDTWAVPEHDGTAIRLVDLATHTSGLPRMPTNFKPKHPANPYDDYGPERLRDFLGKHRLRRAIGERFEYSNLGVGFLGYAISQGTGKSYEQRVLAEICKPLGMTSTRVHATEKMQPHLARAHFGNGLPSTSWDFGVLAPAGAIRSSVHDMLRFARAYISPPEGALGAAIRAASRHKHKLNDLRSLGYCIIRISPLVFGARGLPKESVMLTHNGRTGGYVASMYVLPERKLALVMLSNEAKRLEPLPQELMTALVKRRRATPPAKRVSDKR